MKRWISLFLNLIVVLSLTACNDQPSVTSENGTESVSTEIEETLATETSSGENEEETKEPEPDPVTGVTEAVAAQYDEAWPFSEGFAVVGRDDGERMKYNYIDTQGQLLLEEWVDVARSFSEGLACVGYDSGTSIEKGYELYRFGYMDVNGAMVIPAEILSYESFSPCAFYHGYAEIIYYDSAKQVFCTNVIDREGNRLFDFDVYFSGLRSDRQNGHLQQRGRSRKLMAQGHESGYYYENDWMRAYVNGFDGNVVLTEYSQGGWMSHVVDAEGNVLRTMERMVTALGDDYYVQAGAGDDPATIYDSRWNLLDDKTYDWIEETEHGLYLATNEFGRYILLNRYLTALSDPYHEVRVVPDGYLVNVGNTARWKLRGPDGEEKFLFSEVMNDCSYQEMDCYTPDGYQKALRGVYVGNDMNDTKITYVFDTEGNLLLSVKGIYKPEVTLLTEDGLWLVEGKEQDMVIDQSGAVILELPYAKCAVYGADEERIYLYAAIENQYSSMRNDFGLLELVATGGSWEIVDKGIVGINEFDFCVPRYRVVLAENEESLIVSEALGTGTVTLESKDGTVLEEDCEAVSLAENGLYLVVREAQGACLKYFGEAVSEVYDNIDVLSEDHIAFCEDGKWGYLRIERE